MTLISTRWMTFLPAGHDVAVPQRQSGQAVPSTTSTEAAATAAMVPPVPLREVAAPEDNSEPIFDLELASTAVADNDQRMDSGELFDLTAPLQGPAPQPKMLKTPHPWPIWLATVITGLWLALILGRVVLQQPPGAPVDMDRLIGVLSAGFMPVAAVWLIVMVLTRRQSLIADHHHLEYLLANSLAPLRQAEQDAAEIVQRTESHVARIDHASDKLNALMQVLRTPFNAQVQRLEEVAHRLDTTKGMAEESAQQLRAVLAELGKLASDVAEKMPIVVATMDQARIAGVQNCADVGHAAHQLITTLQAAAGQAQDLEPLVRTATAQAETAAIVLHERLQDLRAQSLATSSGLDTTTAQVADILEQSRQWATDHMAAIEAAIAHLDGLSNNRLRSLATDLSKLGENGNTLLTTMTDTMSVKLNGMDGAMHERLGRLREDWQALLATTDQIGTEVGLKLLETMSRVRTIAEDVATVAADSATNIVASAEQTLEQAQAKADAVTQATLNTFESHTEKLVELAQTANSHAASMKAALARETNDNLAKLSATIIDSLNAYAIDIAKLFAAEITDDDWRSYMGGDRGLFVRRFIKLAPKGIEAKVALRVKADSEFREAVDRFVRGFESLLKLSMGNGDHDSLSIALLASDLGKLYVILAKATERL